MNREELSDTVINSLQVVEYDGPDVENINSTLGISRQRFDELHDIIRELLRSGKLKRTTQLFAEVSKHCRNANEIVWLGYEIGHRVGEVKGSFSQLKIGRS